MNSLFFLLVLALPLYSQTFRINGYVSDSESKEHLAYATIRVKDNPSGTTANSEGRFHLELPKGDYQLIISFIGYRSKTRAITIPEMKSIEVSLEPNSIVLPEIVIGSDAEDPAYRIIREARKRKAENQKGLVTLEFDAYTKRIMKSEGQITLIEESFIRGYDSVGIRNREFTLATYKSENLKSKINKGFDVSKVRFNNKYVKLNNVDFTDEMLDMLGNKIYLPLCQDAFDYYDYKLKNTRKGEEKSVYTIEVIPRSKIRPLLQGTIFIEDSTFALVGVELETNQGMTIPFLTGLKLDFIQRMSRDEGYWLPQYTKMNLASGLNLNGLLSLGKIDFELVYSISSLKINSAFPDSIFTMKENPRRNGQVKLTVGTGNSEGIELSTARDSLSKDSLYKPIALTRAEIDSLRPVPLSEAELTAYNFLDSTKKVTSFLKPKGALSTFINTEDKKSESGLFAKLSEAFFEYIDFNNTRVGGAALGLKYKNDFRKALEYNASARYSFGLKRTELEGGLNIFLSKEKQEGIFLNGFSRIKRWNENTQFGDLINAASVSFGLEDNFNYFFAKGYKVGLWNRWSESFSTHLDFISEKQSSLTDLYYHRIINSSRGKRLNPAISEGQDNRLAVSLTLGQNPFAFQPIEQSGISVLTETSLKDLNSNFDYFKVRSIAQIRFKTIFRELLLSPYMLIRAEGGIINGSYGLQHILSPENSVEVLTTFGQFKGLRPYEYTGSKMLAFHAEHNWVGVIFQSLGLTSLRDQNIGIITGASVLKTWDTPAYFKVSDQKQPYWEAYISINGLYLLRLDIAYTSNKEPVLRLGMAQVF